MNKTVNSNNFDNEQATLRDIKLEFNEKGLVIIQVPSESEKTSLLIKLTQNNKFMDEAYGNMHNIIYLSQDIELIESMSIFDNLIITLSDNSKIESLLKKYNLYNLRHRKINKCTLLQKKQIQFMKSLLLNPNILICDEPLSSLDYENAMDLMEVIQDSSKFFLVIAVMKDSTLANKYANRIIEINKGALTSDKLINKYSNLEFTNNLPQKNCFDTLLAGKRHLFSKPFRFLLNLSLIMLISLFAYLQFNILSSMNSHVDNLILSNGNQLENRIKGEDASLYTKYYRKFDLLFFKDIQETLINNP
ncbi:MAG: ATP-binding cassette domain-containing protein [Anaerorhabdus sp.]|uniref:ATP-binding cassette domain-containing protein n=1 Tax=Anaerorhabdus sp. TaxID=1872524 RepID=UPI003A860199